MAERFPFCNRDRSFSDGVSQHKTDTQSRLPVLWKWPAVPSAFEQEESVRCGGMYEGRSGLIPMGKLDT